MLAKIITAYLIVGIFIALLSLTSRNIRIGFKKDFAAYLFAIVAVILLYPIPLIKGFIERSKKDED